VLLQNVDPVLQKAILPDPYSFDDTLANHAYDLDSLKRVIGTNKGLPQGFERAGAIAYSAYPELKDVEIDMVFINGGARWNRGRDCNVVRTAEEQTLSDLVEQRTTQLFRTYTPSLTSIRRAGWSSCP
jgi:hypothetical protein